MYQHRLGQLVKQRRQERGLSIRAAAKAAGMDRATWTALEEGSRTTRDWHYAGIERALDWTTGYIASIVRGDHPDVREPQQPELLDDNERLLWSMDGVPEDLRREYLRMYRERQHKPPGSQETG